MCEIAANIWYSIPNSCNYWEGGVASLIITPNNLLMEFLFPISTNKIFQV